VGYLRNILLALGGLTLATGGFGAGPWPVALVPLLCLLPYALLGLANALGKRGRWRFAAAAHAAIVWSAPVCQFLALFLCGWSEAVEGFFEGSSAPSAWPGPELLLGLAPYTLCEVAAIDARSRSTDRRRDVQAGLRRFHLRMLLSALAPLVLFVLASSAAVWHPTARAWVEEVALVNSLFSALLLVLFALTLPALLRNTWDTQPLPAGWQRTLLLETARRAGLRCKEVRVWHTSNLLANAAVIGFLPQHRVVLFSDALLAELGPAELAAVFAHEIGHVKRRHVWVFAAWALGFFLLADVALSWLALESLVLELGIFGAVLLAWYLSFGYLSRRFELDADLESVATTGDVFGLIRALEQVGGAHAREQGSWRHFSVAERVRFLAAHQADGRVGAALRRRLARWTAAGAVLCALGVAGEAFALARDLPAERVRVDLRLGRYAAAEERAAGLALDERMRAAVTAAGSVSADLSAADLYLLGLERLQRGDAAAALAFVDLGGLRGGTGPDGVAEALEGFVLGEARVDREDVADPAWSAALERLVRSP
jgi:Zn-dependent protease with chaperone function